MKNLVLVIAVLCVVSSFALGQSGSIRGKVFDSDRTPLTGVTVRVENTSKGAVSKSDGSFVIPTLLDGSYTLVFKLLGYIPATQKVIISNGKQSTISVTLKQDAVAMKGVEVTANRRKQEQTDTRPSVLTIDPREAKFKAGGVEDVFRSLQSMPGVVAPSDFSSQLVVRGSGPDQNLILMDNIEIFNPYRLYGFISLFNPETVSGVSLLTGGFPAKYSDRLSAVLDVKNRDGYTGNGYFAGKVNISLTNANIVTEGALPFGNGSWLLSTRRTYYDLIAGPIARAQGAVDGDVALPNFRDLQGKITLHPDDNLTVYINALTSRDNTQFQSGANRKNADSISITDRSFNDVLGSTIVWSPSENFVSSLGISYYENKGANTFGGSGGSGQLLGTTDQVSREDFARLQDSLRQAGLDIPQLYSVSGETGFNFKKTALKLDNIWKIDSNNTFEAGIQQDFIYTGVIANFEFDPRLVALRKNNPRVPPLPESYESGVDYIRTGVYAQNNFRITDKLTVQPGIRTDYFALIDKVYFAPRISASYAFDDITTLRAAWGDYYQSPGYEKLFDAQVFLDLTSPETQSLNAEKATHYILGLERMISPEWQVRVESYYKKFSDLILPKTVPGTIYTVQRVEGEDIRTREGWTTPTATIGDSLTSTPTNSATGESYGIELMLQKIQSYGENTLYGWVSYSYAFANRYRNGYTIPFNFDRRHALNIVGGYKYAEWLDLSFTFQYGSGFPWTKAVGIKPRVITVYDSTLGSNVAKLDQDWRGVVFDVDRGGLENVNQYRLPDYHRLDVRFTTYADWFDYDWTFYLDVINVYNNRNVIAEQYRVDREKLELTTRQTTMLPILPTLGFSVKF